MACLPVGATIAPLSHRLRLSFGASAFAAVVSLMPGIFMFQAASGTLALSDQGAAISTATMFGIWRNMTTALAIMLAMTAGLIGPKIILDLRLRAGGSGDPSAHEH